MPLKETWELRKLSRLKRYFSSSYPLPGPRSAVFFLSLSLKLEWDAKLHLMTKHIYLGVGVTDRLPNVETLVRKFEGDYSGRGSSFIQLLKDAT